MLISTISSIWIFILSIIINLLYVSIFFTLPVTFTNLPPQFAPFSALPGHNDAVKETERVTEIYHSLDEEEKERINHILQNILYNIHTVNQVSVKYFIEDEKKSGGRFVKVTGRAENGAN